MLTMTRDTSDPLDVASKFDPAAGRLSIDSGQKVSSEPGCFSNAGRIGSMLAQQTRWRERMPRSHQRPRTKGSMKRKPHKPPQTMRG